MKKRAPEITPKNFGVERIHLTGSQDLIILPSLFGDIEVRIPRKAAVRVPVVGKIGGDKETGLYSIPSIPGDVEE